jgi:threonine aldolase
VIDLRSDTVTRPTPAMRRAMADAEVGDDQYREDPTVEALQDEAAELLGKQAALYVPSGTMGNQLALLVQTRPGDAVVAGATQHVVLYEDGAGPRNAGVSWLGVPDGDGTIAAADVVAAIEGGAHHQPRPTLVCIEDTHMAAGGRVWSSAQRQELSAVAAAAGVAVHLDGARLWHAAAATGSTPAERAAGADTVMCCLSKGLAAPIGSVLAGPADLIDAARRERHRLGGAWRQAGVVAAAGLVALRHMRGRLEEDHERARRLADAVAERWPDSLDPRTVQTNIVVFDHPEPDKLLAHLADAGVLAGTVAPRRVRLVTHLDLDDAGVAAAVAAIHAAP